MFIILAILMILVSPIVNAASYSGVQFGGAMASGDATSSPSYPAGSTHFDMKQASNWFNVVGGVSQLGYLQTNVYSRAFITTTSTSITVDGYSNYPFGYGELGVRVNGADNQIIQFTGIGNKSYTITLPAGAKTVEFINGAQQYASPIQGAFITGLTVLNDTDAAIYSPTYTEQLVVFGNSISIGYGSTHPTTGSWPELIRGSWATGTVDNYGWGAVALLDVCTNTTTCNALGDTLTGSWRPGVTNKMIWLEPGTNDWSSSRVLSTFQTNYGILLDRLHNNSATATVTAQSPLVRSGETTPNSRGNTLQDFRDAIATECNSRSTFCHYIDGTSIMDISNMGDGVHPNNAAQALYATYVETTLGI